MTFKQQLINAAVKLQRAVNNDGVDPVSGFTADDIADWIATNPATIGDDVAAAQARAVLRRFGYAELAETI